MSDRSVPVVLNPSVRVSEGPASVLRTGQSHPLEDVSKLNLVKEIQGRKDRVGLIHGGFAKRRMDMEERILSQFHRLPGLKSSYLGLEIVTGKDSEFGFEDYLNDPEYSTQMIDIHSEIEKMM